MINTGKYKIRPYSPQRSVLIYLIISIYVFLQ